MGSLPQMTILEITGVPEAAFQNGANLLPTLVKRGDRGRSGVSAISSSTTQ